MNHTARRFSVLIAIFALCGQKALAHGGVVAEEDLCVIEIGVFRAHFTIYQPETRASKEFCEDLPDVSSALFVMDFLHDSLREVPVDLRIIPDIDGRTIYASWDDIRQIPDLEAVTEYYQAPRVYPAASMSVEHQFEQSGWYIGIVTTRHPTLDREYQAVFGFHVGRKSPGYWPLIILIVLGVQLHYWVAGGGYTRWRRARANRQ